MGAGRGDGRLRVGITDYAQDALGDVVYVDVPDVGTNVTAQQAFSEVESTKSVSDVYAPVSNASPSATRCSTSVRIGERGTLRRRLDRRHRRERCGRARTRSSTRKRIARSSSRAGSAQGHRRFRRTLDRALVRTLLLRNG